MVNLSDIHPLTGFLRNHRSHLERLQTSGQPEVLTVNGRARIVVQDALAYQAMVERLDRLESEEVLRQRLDSLRKGEPGVPMEQVLDDVRDAFRSKTR